MLAPYQQAAHRMAVANDFVEAVRQSDWDRADRLQPELAGVMSDEIHRSSASLHMQRERWAEAAESWALVTQSDVDVQMRLKLCKNLADLKQHRYEIYKSISQADVSEDYTITPSTCGKPSILARKPGGGGVMLCGGPDPDVTVATVIKQIDKSMNSAESLALLSIGDGYLLKALAADKRKYFLDREQAIFVFEPDPRLALACMLLHDYSGPNGPIQQRRIQWYVGPKWLEQYRLDALTNRCLPFPNTTLKLGINPAPIEQGVIQVIGELSAMDRKYAKEVSDYYASLPADHFEKMLSNNPPRMPRILLMTTRFSTVLQYSTRDTAEAFRQLDWDAQVLIEAAPYEMLSRVGIRKTLAEFKPDLIFQIDHNRAEQGDLLPANVPFVNWIQDLLPNLMNKQAGERIGLRDFVLTPSLQRWVDDFSYPRRQCLEFRKLTRVPHRPIGWSSRADRVVYVSTWSQTPQQMMEELLRTETGKSKEIVQAACQRMIETYKAGQSLATMGEVRRLLIDVMREQECTAEEATIRTTATRLFDRLNNLLFRQQGLFWASKACKQLNLNLEIYGNGWSKNPDFASYAKGTIAYGDDLEELTRSAGIYLVLEPFVCIAHQRLLDSLVAGGFCISRHHPANQLIPQMIELLNTVDESVVTESQLRKALHGAALKQLQDTLDGFHVADLSPHSVDHVALIRQLMQSGFLSASGILLPELNQTTFNTEAQMKQLFTRFTRDDMHRTQIAKKQRQFVESNYSYASGIKRMISFLHDRLSTENQVITKAA